MAQSPAESPHTPAESDSVSTAAQDPSSVDPFVQHYAADVDDDLLTGRGDTGLAEMAAAHRRIADTRVGGEHLVDVADGLVHIVSADRPFLVDSVMGTLARDGVEVGLMLHPRFSVRRDAQGVLQEVHPEGTSGEGERESWIRIEIDPSSDAAAVKESLSAALDDVARTVADWDAMRSATTAAADELANDAVGDADERAAAAEFLRWLAEDHFTFLGCRDHRVRVEGEQVEIEAIPGTGLGVLQEDSFAETITPLAQGGDYRETIRHPLTVGKSSQVLHVHRATYPDLIAVRFHDESGELVERRIAGHFSSTAYTSSVQTIPLVADKVAALMDQGGWTSDSHSGALVMRLLETFPRDELFQAPLSHLRAVVTRILRLANQVRTALFLRHDAGGQYITALVYLPRERYTTTVRQAVETLLRESTGADDVSFTAHVSDAPLARLYYVLRSTTGGLRLPDESVTADLSEGVADAARTWEDRLVRTGARLLGEEEAARLIRPWRGGFPIDYQDDFDSAQTIADLKNLVLLDDGDGDRRFACALYDPRRGHLGASDPASSDPAIRRFKIFSLDTPALTDVMPVFRDLGVEVIDEEPYELTRTDGLQVGVYDFSLRVADPAQWEQYSHEQLRDLVESAVTAVWSGEAESDGLNALAIRAGLGWRQIALLRALVGYLRQTGTAWSNDTLVAALVDNESIAADLVALVEERFDPDRHDGAASEQREAAEQAIIERVETRFEDVVSLDHDRILRALIGIVRATIRTSWFATDDAGDPLPRTSFKIVPARVPDLRKPHPAYEIWVHSPQVEGVHLRFGDVARGGLRWSDRRDDFRTEVLGLVKAQMVKNAVIVPTGSKGGFYAKQLPDASDREAWLEAGKSAYRSFISGLLDLTDNRVAGDVVPPHRVVRHDGDDPYLVVAADKGTATFSDIANAVSRQYGFWLDDAFASGGSIGYDHKAMGITARGAWESVKRHFREMGHDTQTQDFTVVGIGDMGGDVFGNGMLLSEHIRLIAAFNHLHIVIDPNPDAASSFAERRRLFETPGTSWADYDESLISDGGGVWPRSAKSITLGDEAARAIGLKSGCTMTPNEVIHQILQAPVDLLWNGGIGTYIKSTEEDASDVGDRANDAIRVNGDMVRAKVIGEGGNLGATQRGRIEAAENGVRVNTDAIDNSAGVDTSDHEVNIKIVLGEAKSAGQIDEDERVAILESMTDEVAEKVLRDNYEQNVLLGNARAQHGVMLGVHERLMHELEARGELDRELEFLPDDAELRDREREGRGLTSPELSVLLAYSKLALKADLLESGLPDDPATAKHLTHYFPGPVRERFADLLDGHPLRREIVATSVANDVVNRGGVTFIQRAVEETSARPEQVVSVFLVAREIFGLDEFVAQVEELDNQVPTSLQTKLYLEFRRLLDRAARWFLANRPGGIDITVEIERFQPVIAQLRPQLPGMLRGEEAERLQGTIDELTSAGVPEELASWASSLLDLYSALDITDIAADQGADPAQVATVYYAVSEAFSVDRLLMGVSGLPREERWDSMARAALREDLYATLQSITRSVLSNTDSQESAEARLRQWCDARSDAVARAQSSIHSILDLDRQSIASLSVALRTLRSVTR